MILAICGSTRPNGNSEWMIDQLLDSAKNEGALTRKILLRDLDIEYCIGCDACHDNGGNCIQNDDMKKMYPLLIEADIILLSCPNYFANVSALMKNFMDRTNALVRVKPRRLENKLAIGLCVGGQDLEDTQHCEDALVRFFKDHKMKVICIVKARGDGIGALENNFELKNRLADIGKKVAKNEFASVSSFR